jgi:hypothetical protein
MGKYLTIRDRSRIPQGSTSRVVCFDSLEEKARFLDASASFDAMRGKIRSFARRFLYQGDPELRTRQIHRWVRDNIRYEQDYRVSQDAPGEEFADSTSQLRRGFEDCDGKARLFVALMRAAEMLRPLSTGARIRPIFQVHPYKDFVHVQAEVLFPGSKRIETANPSGWVIAELILKGCELGQNPDELPRGPAGERIIA